MLCVHASYICVLFVRVCVCITMFVCVVLCISLYTCVSVCISVNVYVDVCMSVYSAYMSVYIVQYPTPGCGAGRDYLAAPVLPAQPGEDRHSARLCYQSC